MSGREDRISELKRHHSRFDRETSPKRSRRDGKPDAERPPVKSEVDKDRAERDHWHHRMLHDPLPLESGNMSRESEKLAGEHKGAMRHSSDPKKIPQSHCQHDDLGSSRQNGRGFSRRTDNERGWWRDSKEQRNDRPFPKTASVYPQQKDEEIEANPKLPARKRPAFIEHKFTTDPERTYKALDDSMIPNQADAINSRSRYDRDHNSRYSRRPVAGERELDKARSRRGAGERELNNGHSWRGNFSSRDRSNANNRYRGGDRFTARQAYHPTGGSVEKWKHDLYDEANKSPPPKNEEDQISKIEALLTS